MPHDTAHSKLAQPSILFLDAYDSFSNNIVALLQDHLDANVTIVQIDDERYLHDQKAFNQLLSGYDAVVAGPGPGTPDNAHDVGLIERLWELPSSHLIPVLGICLGFQSLARAHGATVARLRVPRHGIVSPLSHHGSSIFANVGRVEAVLYQSLHARIDVHLSEGCSRFEGCLWESSEFCPSLKPLAWVIDDINGPILMGIAHVEKPFWGLQFHPESICTTFEGASIIRNWWRECQKWTTSTNGLARSVQMRRQPQLLERTKMGKGSTRIGTPTRPVANGLCAPEPVQLSSRQVYFERIACSATDTADICEALRSSGRNVLLLESSTARSELSSHTETGRFSILGIVEPGKGERILYFVNGKRLRHVMSDGGVVCKENIDIWSYVKDFMKKHNAHGGPTESPFWGGLIGYASYEACLESICVEPSPTEPDRPDICFAFVEHSLVLDHVCGEAILQTIGTDDSKWLAETASLLATSPSHASARAEARQSLPAIVQRTAEPRRVPAERTYSDKVRSCQSHIRAGDSYELCLTDRTSMMRPRNIASTAQSCSWSLYRSLRSLNPAPFAAYVHFPAIIATTGSSSEVPMRIPTLSIVSSSPERFLSWTRTGHVQLRPIKGTIAKTHSTTLEHATALLSTSKERAENLMIVDLIRHDLHGVAGAGNVRVSKLMQVEEYESVFQLVSVIEGQLAQEATPAGVEPKVGIDVLAASLPPGSMTGAPKKRSCELLRGIEGDEARGIYSGVLGYLDVGGGGDFSVVIRTAWSWGDEDCAAGDDGPDKAVGEIWHIGAGGAVTSQSTESGEWQEMLAKRARLMRLFD